MAKLNAQKAAKTALSSVAWFLKPRLGTQAIRNLTTDTVQNANQLIAVAKGTFSREPAAKNLEWLRDIADHKSRFRAAMAEKGVVDSEIEAIERGTLFRFKVWFILATLSIGYSIAMLGGGHLSGALHSSFLPAVWCISFVLFLLAKTARASFDLYQIRLQALVPFADWLNDSSAWLGARPSRRVLSILTFLGVGAAISIPHMAFADGGSAASPSMSQAVSWITGAMQAQDLSLTWLVRLFPGGVGTDIAAKVGVDSSTDSFSPLFMAFNSVVMAIGSAMLAWHTVSGAVSTAHEGKVLGQKWHTAWAPIRVCIGVASLAPVTGGYCGAQLLAIQILMGGYGFADGIWTVYVNQMLSGDTAAAVVAPNISISASTVKAVVAAEICSKVIQTRDAQIKAINGQASLFSNTTRPRAITPTPDAVQTVKANGTYVWDYGSICGTITLPPVNAPTTLDAQLVTTVQSALVGGVLPVRQDIQGYVDTFAGDRAKALGEFVGAVQKSGIACYFANQSIQNPIACDNAVLDTDIANKYNDIIAASDNFSKTVVASSKTLVSKFAKDASAAFKTKSIQMGWASAGALNAAIVSLSSSALDLAISSQPITAGQNVSELSSDVQKDIVNSRLQSANFLQAQGAAAAINTSSTTLAAQELAKISGDDASSVESVISRVFGNNVGWASAMSATSTLDDINPMTSMISHGNLFLLTGESVFGLYAITKGSADGAAIAGNGWIGQATTGGLGGGFLAGVASVVSTAGIIVLPLCITMIMIGLTEAAVLPMVPYVIWFFAVISCAGFAVSFIVAAPLAAFMHVRMDGDELIGPQQKPFYSTLFQGALRPTLLLFGLFASNKVYAVMAQFLNSTISLSMISAQNTHTSGVMITVALHVITAYLEYQLAVHSLEMITKVPSMVSQMLGVQDIGGDEHKNAISIQGAIVSGGRGGLQTAMQGALGPKDDKAGRAKAAATQESIAKSLGAMSSGGGGNNTQKRSLEGE